MEETKNNKVLMRGMLIYAIGNFGTKFLNFFIVPLYTYFILPEDLGDYDLLVTTVSLLSPLITLKISDAAYRWIIKEKENEIPYISATYTLLLRNCFFISIFLLLVNGFIPIWNCGYFIAILVGDRILECLQKLLRGLKNQKLFAISGLIHTIIFVSCNLIKVCFLKEGVTALLESSVISLYSTIIFILLVEKRLRNVKLSVNYSVEHQEMLRYSAPLVPSTLSWWVMSASDRYVIRWFIDSAANGIYSVAYKFPSVLQTIFMMFNNAWTDMALVELGKGHKSEEYTKQLFQQLYKFSFDMVYALIPLTHFVMNVILSSAYKKASVYIGFLYLGTIFQGFSSFSSIGYLQGRKTSGAAKTSIYGAIINLAIDFLFIRSLGLFAAALSTFLGFFVMWIVRMLDIRKEFPIQIDVKNFSIYLLVGIVFAVGIIWSTNLIDLVLTALAGIFFLYDNRVSVMQVFWLIRKKKA